MSNIHNNRFFPNLNGLRFIAAFLVVFDHIEQYKDIFGVKNYWHSVIGGLGSLAVTLFFSLSGYLITYLMLEEKAGTGAISVKKFYVRRILRIWPLYYLIVILGFAILPNIHFFYIKGLSEVVNDHYNIKLLLYLLILPNVAAILFPAVPFASQLWSIGVEEQFYLFWPWLLKMSKNRIAHLILVIIIIKLLGIGILNKPVYFLNSVFHFADPNSHTIFYLCDRLALFFSKLEIGSMSIGAIFAHILFFKKERLLGFFYSKITWIATLFILLVLIFSGKAITHEVYALLFSIIILNLGSDPQKKYFLENRVFRYLGKISYGIYMYHVIAIAAAFKFVSYFDPAVSGVISNLALYFATVILVVSIASVSYYRFELKLLNLKSLFS